jgi:hypothetical protein
MSNDLASEQTAFDAHLCTRNIARVQFASWYFAAVMLALLVAEAVVPVLRSSDTISVKAISGLYFCGLAWACRRGGAAAWPKQALPLLFGAGQR